MAVTKDQKITRYGTGDGHQPVALGIKATVKVYRGTIALTDTSGFLKNASSPASTDKCWGLIQRVRPGDGQIDGAPGITGGATDGAVGAEIDAGTFFLGSSTGSDQLSAATLGTTVYVYDEITVAATNGGSTRPVAGIHVATDSTGRYPGAYAIKLGSAESTGGGV
jgi:hypothetical protein